VQYRLGGLYATFGSLAENGPQRSIAVHTWTDQLPGRPRRGEHPGSHGAGSVVSLFASVVAGDPPLPVDLRFTGTGVWFDFLSDHGSVRADPLRGRLLCHPVRRGGRALRRPPGHITIPVFYLGAAGGFGEVGVYTLDLLGSADKWPISSRSIPRSRSISGILTFSGRECPRRRVSGSPELGGGPVPFEQGHGRGHGHGWSLAVDRFGG